MGSGQWLVGWGVGNKLMADPDLNKKIMIHFHWQNVLHFRNSHTVKFCNVNNSIWDLSLAQRHLL